MYFGYTTQTSTKQDSESVENYTLFNSSGGGFPKFHLLVVEFIEIETTGNHHKLQNYGFQTSSEGSFIRPIPFYDAVSTLGLDASVHSQKRTVYGFQIAQNFLMELRQFAVQPNHPLL